MNIETILNKKQITLEDANQIFCMGASKIGFAPMVYAMATFFNKLGDAPDKQYQQRVIGDFLIEQVSEVFELENSDFFQNNVREYRQAKWAFYHLFRK